MSKYWAATHNAPNATAIRRLHELIGRGDLLSACYSLECASRFHLQVFLAFKSKQTLSKVKVLLSSGWALAHFEQARNPNAAHDYAVKNDGTTVSSRADFDVKAAELPKPPNVDDVLDRYLSVHPIDWDFKPYRGELGTWVPVSGPGARTDLAAFSMSVVAAAGAAEPRVAYVDSILKHPEVFLRVFKGSELLFKAALEKRAAGALLVRPKPSVNIFYGPPGTGKSYAAIAGRTGGDTFIMRNNKGAWWDGYTGQKRIVIEEFAGWLPLPTLLGVTDTYAMRLEVKGGFVDLAATEVILTTNIWWEDFYKSAAWAVQKAAFRRRVDTMRFYADKDHPGAFSVLDMDAGPPGPAPAFTPVALPLPVLEEADPHVFDDLVIPDGF